MKKRIFTIAALIAAMMFATSCSKDDDTQNSPDPAPSTTETIGQKSEIIEVPFSITVNQKNNSLTKAKLVADGDNLVQEFVDGDELVITGDGLSTEKESVLTIDKKDIDKESATFSGTLYFVDDNKKSMKKGSFPPIFTATLRNKLDGSINPGKPLTDYIEVTGENDDDILNMFARYGYLKSDFFYIENAKSQSIILHQYTVVLKFNLVGFSGAKVKVKLPEQKYTTLTLGKDVTYLIIPDGTTVKSQMIENGAEWTLNLDEEYSSDPYAATVWYDIERKLPDNCIPGLFSVQADKQVFFSKGNLQATYNGTDWTWGFAPSQTSYIGKAAANTSINGDGKISGTGTVDLFGWVGESNTTWTGAAMYGISNSTTTNSNETYGNKENESLKSDWGNVFGKDSPWRTLTGGNTGYDEWYYLIDLREDKNDKLLYGQGNVDGINGVILLPDDWTYPTNLSESSTSKVDFKLGTSEWSNTYTVADWANMEANGAVFLPAAGRRYGTGVGFVGSYGYYWSSSGYYKGSARDLYFISGQVHPYYSATRHEGYSVRLVRPLQ